MQPAGRRREPAAMCEQPDPRADRRGYHAITGRARTLQSRAQRPAHPSASAIARLGGKELPNDTHDFRRAVPMLREVRFDPFQVGAQRSAIASGPDLPVAARVRMLPVLVPDLAGRVERPAQADLGEHDTILVHPPERFLVAAHVFEHLAPEQQAARRIHVVAQKTDEQLRWLHQRVRRAAERLHIVARQVRRIPGPAVPHVKATIHRAGLRMLLEQLHLTRQLLRDPDVVAVEERDHLAASRGQSEVAGGAHAAIRMSGVFQVPDPVGVRRRVPARDLR